MFKKPALLSWFDKNIKTKEDFQLVVVVLFIVFIICTKCYMAFRVNQNNHSTADAPTHVPELSTPRFSSGLSFTK